MDHTSFPEHQLQSERNDRNWVGQKCPLPMLSLGPIVRKAVVHIICSCSCENCLPLQSSTLKFIQLARSTLQKFANMRSKFVGIYDRPFYVCVIISFSLHLHMQFIVVGTSTAVSFCRSLGILEH